MPLKSLAGRNRVGTLGSGVLGTVQRSIGITTTGIVTFVMAVVGWVLAKALSSKGLFLLVYLGVLLLVVCFALARRRRRLTAVRSELPRRAREGQLLAVDLQLQSKGRLSLFTVEEQLPAALGAPVRVSVEVISPGRPWNHRYTFRPRARGVYQVGPLSATWTDPLGIASGQQTLLDPVEIIVHPSTEPVLDRPLTRELEDPPVRPPKTKPWPTGFEFYGMRDYVRGDDLRRVVWKAVARTGKMMVRESEQGISDRVNIILDTNRENHRRGEPSDTFETAVRVAASVGVRHIKDGFAVGLESNSATLAESLRGPRAALAFLDHLARVQLEREPMQAALRRLLQRRGRRSHNVVITSHFDAQAAAAASLLSDSGDSFLVAVIVWDESDPMSAQRAVAVNAQVVQVRLGAALSGTFASLTGAGVR